MTGASITPETVRPVAQICGDIYVALAISVHYDDVTRAAAHHGRKGACRTHGMAPTTPTFRVDGHQARRGFLATLCANPSVPDLHP